MKIAILADPLDTQYAGIHVFCKELIAALLHLDQINQYFIVRANPSNDFPNATELIFPIKNIPLHNRFRQFTSIPKKLKELKIDVAIEMAHFGPFGLDASVKKVTFIHDLTPIIFPAFHSRLSYVMHKRLLPSILKRADLILCNSETSKNDLKEYYPFSETKTLVTYLGANKIFKPTHDKSILEKYNIIGPYFLFVGTIEPRKNVETLFAAWKQFKKTGGKEKLVIAGKKGWAFGDLIKDIEHDSFADEIICTDFVPEGDLPALYSHATAFVYPSHYEGFGLPVLEAMACSSPVILANNSALLEVGGSAAMYFKTEDAEALTKLLTKITTEDQKIFREKSIQQAKNFNWERTAATILKELEKLFD